MSVCVSVSPPSSESYFGPQADLEFSLYPRLASVLWSSYFIVQSGTPSSPAKDAGSLRSLQILTSFGCQRGAVVTEFWEQKGTVRAGLGEQTKAEQVKRRTMGHFDSVSISLSTKCSPQSGYGAHAQRAPAWQNRTQGTQAQGAERVSITALSESGRADQRGTWGKRSACRGSENSEEQATSSQSIHYRHLVIL